ncbi:protein fluG [Viridothelium virens]|uniref:Glutamine synthetase n=1 Tax=Viridothelium virens TaxID=1048519 RepID=A0A6A6HBJ5_VIRVR|nr:protein fluG [Viridothelium virens]
MATLPSFLHKYPSVKYIRLQFVDFSGILHTRFLTVQHCLDLIARDKYPTVGGKSLLHAVNDAISSIVPPAGLCELLPDWQSLRICPYAPGHASVMCFVYDTDSSEPFHLCPRRKLVDQLEEWENVHAVTFSVGFEIEFALLDAAGNVPEDVDAVNAWSTTTGLRGTKLRLIEEIVEALQASEIRVLLFHTDAPNQLQIVTGPSNPVDAIDALMQTHECIKHTSIRYGFRATMAPKPLPEDLATGAHAHISIKPQNKRDNFLAGVLEDLPAIFAFTMPSYDSYHRVTGLRNNAGTWVAWGTENRYVPIRAIKMDHWELRGLDATANFYLALLTTLAGGMRGIKETIPLHSCDCRQNPYELREDERRGLGIVVQLPKNLKESITALKESTVFDAVLGSSLKQQYIAVKEVDERDMGALSAAARREWFVKMF